VRAVRIAIIIRGTTLTAVAPLLASCSEGVLDPHGPIGQAELTILYNATAIMLAVLIVFGSMIIMANLNHAMMPMDRLMQMQR
jgi:heme/copper-type cytochrome/quinol oxidase subunit 2